VVIKIHTIIKISFILTLKIMCEIKAFPTPQDFMIKECF
jgi:hypothetical protein